jgi:hypothetical protein
MMIMKYLESLPVMEPAKYDSSKSYIHTSVCYSGAPRKHPYDHNKIILVRSPFSSETLFFEFRLADITHAEDLPSIVTESGDSIRMANLWIRKGSLSLKFQAFEVQENEGQDRNMLDRLLP